MPKQFYVINMLMYRPFKQPINRGRPALVCIRTGEQVTIDGKTYYLLKLMYDLKQDYVPYARMLA